MDWVEMVCGGISVGSLSITSRMNRCDDPILGTILYIMYDVHRLHPDVIIMSSSDSNGVRCHVISAVHRLPGILVYSPRVSRIIPDIYCRCRPRIYLGINPGERLADGDRNSSRIGAAIPIADGVGEAIGAAEASVRGVGDLVIVIDDRATGPLSDRVHSQCIPIGLGVVIQYLDGDCGILRRSSSVIYRGRRVVDAGYSDV